MIDELVVVGAQGRDTPTQTQKRCCLHRGRNKMGARPNHWAELGGPESYKVRKDLGPGASKGQVDFEGSEVSL